MKIGLRMPSLKKRIAAKTSVKRFVRHKLGVKAPRGMGIVTNPKRALYNKVYNKTSISIDKAVNTLTKSSSLPSKDHVRVTFQEQNNDSTPPNTFFIILAILFFPVSIPIYILKLILTGMKK